MAPTPTRNHPSTTVKKQAVQAKPKPMFEAVTEIDVDGNFEADIFGEKFTLSSEVNGWLIFLAGSGSSRDVVNLVKSVLIVNPADGEDIEVARRREEDRFNALVGSQRHFTVESAVELINAMTTVAAGNDQ